MRVNCGTSVSRKQAAVHIGKDDGVAGRIVRIALRSLSIHRAEESLQHQVRVAAIAFAELLYGVGEQGAAQENVCVFREEAEDEPRHEVVHVMPAGIGAPLGVLLQQLDIELVQATGRPHINGVVLDLADSRDAGQRQEEADMFGKAWVVGRNGLAGGEVFGF